ncbi:MULTISPECIES: hypothetical protein [unclassified Exiguobacterium]|uniref:hypothetical protein n=1 Tax=unclassified Exiguobacterium TaxID=2644629 RepID=UPI00103FC328|nr:MULTISPECIES: hypothetical protein [unclassified Exiguobacterium]TCI39835.1 hypothetical protein EVJ29_01415 [Exiguobacterium sp. SH4S7]TCI47980.1 hypothetical protein EVJ31_02780 [Exiguobacterium sp. SH5S32]TCI54862.1 hypothetical protein EVJ25_02775 [Exiguobacterium sp. SH1S4]TCI62879.1 hypothetical protein EVJ21_05020 [Exiguobacterium sp. SH0S2]TCI74659.1 hypothetical protein EVJ23_02775 [Exiguobacterium sp. SH1S1]
MSALKRKGRWVLVIGLLVVGGGLLAMSFWKTESSLRPPLPTVRVGSVTAEVRQSTFCWSDQGQGVCEDHGLPGADDLQLVPVKPGAEIDVTFHAEPSNFSFNQIVDGELVPSEQVVPDEPGVYLFETGGDWAQGDSRYVFGVKVEE